MASSSVAGPSQLTVSAPQWRQFTFFDLEDVKDDQDLAQSPRSLRDLRPPVIVTATSTTSPLSPSVIVSSATDITLLDRQFSPIKKFRAWDGTGRGTALIEAGGLLVAIGEDEGSRYPALKVWDLSRDEKRKGATGGGPVMLRNVKIQHGQRPHPVSSMALTSNLSHLAIGLGDGTVLLYRHLLQSLTTSPTSLTSLPKARVIHESSEPITGLGFREPLPTAPSKAVDDPALISLFIVTTNKVLCAAVSGRGGEAKVIDELGSGLGCASMDWDRQNMIVARDEAIYLYDTKNRGPCYAYEGPKSAVSVYKHNLIITSPPFFPSAGSTSATVRHYVSSGGSSSSDISKITIFDLQNKLISYSGTSRDGVREVFSQWNGVFVLGGNGKVSRLDEFSTSAKLDILYRRNLYTLASNVAQSHGVGEAGVADISRKYGDYLYTKADFDGAMSQFIKTIGFLQPSYVIRKFLDAQRIQNLTTYLQELHTQNLANPDHTTLLLNCYTKTSDRPRLDAFIKSRAVTSTISSQSDELPFDLDTAIRVCRQAGFYDHACFLAKRFGRHEEFLRIVIEDAGGYAEALTYLRGLGPKACQENLIVYGKTLLQHEPAATTELLVDLCSGTLGQKPPAVLPDGLVTKTDANGSTAPAVLSYLGYNRVTNLFSGDDRPSTPTAAYPAMATVQANGTAPSSAITSTLPPADISAPIDPSYIPPSPRQYFAHFVDHPDLFTRYLEAVASSLWGQKVDGSALTAPNTSRAIIDRPISSSETNSADKTAVWNTLLELYLFSVKSADATTSRNARDKALALLSQSGTIPYDPMHALILCSTSGFTDGLVLLWESMGMYEDILRFYMEQPETATQDPHPSDQVLHYLDLYGPQNPHLYTLVLRYLTSSSQILSRHSQTLPGILSTISTHNILPPLSIIQLLSRNSVSTVGSVKEWLKEKVQMTREEVGNDKVLVGSYRTETETKKKEIESLGDAVNPEVFQVTRCASCGGQLDLPAVHFMCKHSYHQRCLSDSEPECILCARQHSIIREVRRNQTRLADRHDLFINEVKEAEDGFGIVAGAFGRGLMAGRVDSAA